MQMMMMMILHGSIAESVNEQSLEYSFGIMENPEKKLW